MLGGVAWLLSRAGGGGEAEAGAKDDAGAAVSSSSSSSRSSSTPASSSRPSGGKNAPSRSAPAFPTSMQAAVKERLAEAKQLYNDAIRAQRAGEQSTFKEKGRACQKCLSEIKDSLSEQLAWQEEAVMEGWAQPADYSVLEALWGKISKLDKQARMIGS